MNARTSICGFDADAITIRGRDLVTEIMGRLGFTELFYLQALGRMPTEPQLRILDCVMVTIMEHGLVPSAIATRLTQHGAPESFQGAVAAGILGVGDRYAGTAGECGAVLERIVAAGDDRQEAARAAVRELRDSGRPIPGFGHPIHRENDPRVARLLQITAEADTEGRFLEALEVLETAVGDALDKPLVTNISAAIAAALGEARVPAGLMRGVVLAARCAGLVGHLFEEMSDPAAAALWEGARSAVTYEP